MKKDPTAIAYIISNIEMVLCPLAVVISLLIYYIRFYSQGVSLAGSADIGFIALPFFVLLAQGSILRNLLGLAAVIGAYVYLPIGTDGWCMLYTLLETLTGVIAFGAGIWVWKFVRENFDEVVSRRMKYVNSRASMYGEHWKFTFDRFYTTIASISALGFNTCFYLLLQ